MNKKLIASGVLTALMMGGFSGVQAADGLEARVDVLETAVAGLSDKVGAMDPGAVADEAKAREDEDTKIRGEFAAADDKVRGEFAEADKA
ncbi:MAG: hypothetical protein E7C72_08365, partial [Dialister sp.]|nr:hypothetical protein [Dialister sp.]